jgi:hypothetical protein
MIGALVMSPVLRSRAASGAKNFSGGGISCSIQRATRERFRRAASLISAYTASDGHRAIMAASLIVPETMRTSVELSNNVFTCKGPPLGNSPSCSPGLPH